MRTIVSGIAAMALAAASVAVAFAMPGDMMGGTTGMMMPKCSATTGPVVWWVAGMKMYYMKGSPMYGKGHGMYACRATAVARGGHMGKAMAGGSMSHGASGSMSHGTSGSMSHDAMPMATTAPGGMMQSPMPKSTGSMGTGSGSTITPAPSQPLGGASPPTGTNMGNSSGGQGNTGAPGAGGQTPNNPASTSNNASPQPRPT